MYSANINLSLYGGLASGVPGELRGLEYLHKKYSSKPWKHLLQPAIKVARDGQEVGPDLVRYIASTPNNSFLVNDPSWALDFAPNGTLVKLWDTLYRKRYAKTLEAIAEHGPRAFYHGAIANATINALQATGGSMTLSDLANYTVKIRPASNITYRGFKLTSGSAPSSGAVVLSALKIVEGYDMSTPSQLNLSTHYLDEAMKFGYGQRTELGDPTFVTNITAYQQKMYSEKTAQEVRSLIEANGVLQNSAYNPSNYDILSDDGTSAGVTADKSGLTIAITSTVNTLFGSQVMVPETGVIMNNEMNGQFPIFFKFAFLTIDQISASQTPPTPSATLLPQQTTSYPSSAPSPPSPPPSSSTQTAASTFLTLQQAAPASSLKSNSTSGTCLTKT